MVKSKESSVRPHREDRDGGKLKVLIVTNESEMFCVEGVKGGQGRRYAQLSDEESSRKVPAEDLFGGRFTEVRNLRDRLAAAVKVELAVITWNHGLIEGAMLISPYLGYVSTPQDILAIEEKYALSDKLLEMIEGSDMTVFCVPQNLLSFFIDQGLFSKKSKIVFITTHNLAVRLDDDSFITMPRKGARVGRDNSQELLRICEVHSS